MIHDLARRSLEAIAWLNGASALRDVAQWMDRILGPSLGMTPAERWHAMRFLEMRELCLELEEAARAQPRARRKLLYLYPPTPEGGRYEPPAVLTVVTVREPCRPPERLQDGQRTSRPRSSQRVSASSSGHQCHARECSAPCPPSRLMCGRHWRMVPKPVARKVWETYRPGQEVDKRPSRAYLDAADAAVEAVAQAEMLARCPYMRR